jgi:septal ring factor EnvC (AmiA/AmiB activator)
MQSSNINKRPFLPCATSSLSITMDLSQLPPDVAQLQASQQSQEDESKKAQDQEQMRRDLMAKVLDTAARERRMCRSNCHTYGLLSIHLIG